MAEPTLRLEGVHKAYNVGTPVETEVLHGIDLRLDRGEFCALIGPSGSGKSTLLNLIGLLDRPTSGRLFIAEQEIGRLDDKALTRLRGRSIGFVFQYHYLITAFSALENVRMPMLVERGRPDEAMRRRAESLLESVSLTPWKDHKASELSGGQQQRVAIARALSMEPLLLLADEPTTSLDDAACDRVLDTLFAQADAVGATLLIATHDQRVKRRVGQVLELAPPA